MVGVLEAQAPAMTPFDSPPRLIVVSDARRGSLGRWLSELTALCEVARRGSVLVLLRDRELPIRERQALGERLRLLSHAHGQWLSVSDRLDLALLLDADAVHLAEASVSTDDARHFGARYGRRFWISSACHAPQQIAVSGADAVLLSPVVAPRKGRPALGSAGLREAAQLRNARSDRTSLALYALGGVTHRQARELDAAGADGVAVMGELFQPGAVGLLAAELEILR
jgi:thiamine-phosphate pyrophosphorylase